MSFKASIEYQVMLADLRKAREDAGLSQKDVAVLLKFGLSKVSRHEQGKNSIRPGDLNAYMDLYKIDKVGQARLRRLHGQVSRRKDRWWESYGWVSAGYADLIEAEAVAEEIRTSQTSFVPGLIQVEAYMRRVNALFGRGADEDQLQEGIEVRLRRQEVLTKQRAPIYEAIIATGVLELGDAVLRREQLMNVLELSKLPNVSILVMPDRDGVPMADGACLVLPQGKEKHVADVGGLTVMLDEKSILKYTRRRLDIYRRHAMTKEESIRFIEEMIEGI